MPSLTVPRTDLPIRPPVWMHAAYAAAAAAMIFFAARALDPLPAAIVRGLPLGVLVAMALVPAFRGDRRAARFVTALGLLASLAGDVALPFEFLAGIGAFLLAHVLYLAAMGLPRARVAVQSLALVPTAAFGVAMFRVLAPRLPAELFVPVVVYLTVISLMFARALGRVLAVPSEVSYVWMLVGAALFVASDSLLALLRWGGLVLPYPHVAVLITYLAAQWAIVKSLD